MLDSPLRRDRSAQMLAQSLRAAGAIVMLSSMLCAHAQNILSDRSWAPSSNTSNGTTNITTTAAEVPGNPAILWDVGIATIFAREVLAFRQSPSPRSEPEPRV
jgi:hypothetical protein